MTKTAGKLFYKIGEVCSMMGVEPHVLRYWEMEFPPLSPQKNRAGQRIYRERDLELVEKIRRLLHEEGYTIAGARKVLQGRGGTGELPLFRTSRQASRRAVLHSINKDLAEVLKILNK